MKVLFLKHGFVTYSKGIRRESALLLGRSEQCKAIRRGNQLTPAEMGVVSLQEWGGALGRLPRGSVMIQVPILGDTLGFLFVF